MYFAENNWIIPGRLLASVLPRDIRYLRTLKEMGIASALNLTEDDWPRPWKDECGFVYLHLPVEDFGTPTFDQAAKAVRFIEENISKGGVMVHCRAGLGRTGTIIAAYLIETGMDPDEAIDAVRAGRPGSLEVQSQEDFVRSWKRRGKNG